MEMSDSESDMDICKDAVLYESFESAECDTILHFVKYITYTITS